MLESRVLFYRYCYFFSIHHQQSFQVNKKGEVGKEISPFFGTADADMDKGYKIRDILDFVYYTANYLQFTFYYRRRFPYRRTNSMLPDISGVRVAHFLAQILVLLITLTTYQ